MSNRRVFLASLLACASVSLGSCVKLQQLRSAPPKPIPYDVFDQYFVKNTVEPLPGTNIRQGFCKTQAEFDALFGPAALNQENQFIPENYFDSHVVFYYIQWGNTSWDYKVESLTSEGNALNLQISQSGTPSDEAMFSPCLILGIDKSVPHASIRLTQV